MSALSSGLSVIDTTLRRFRAVVVSARHFAGHASDLCRDITGHSRPVEFRSSFSQPSATIQNTNRAPTLGSSLKHDML
jgi:hypothetical protein